MAWKGYPEGEVEGSSRRARSSEGALSSFSSTAIIQDTPYLSPVPFLDRLVLGKVSYCIGSRSFRGPLSHVAFL